MADRKDKTGRVISLGDKLKGQGLTLHREVTGTVIALEAGGVGNVTIAFPEQRPLPDGNSRDVEVWEFLLDVNAEVVA